MIGGPFRSRSAGDCGARIVGLIGGIGSGKSLVAERLRAKGAFVIDADRTGHEVLKQPEVLAQVVAAFGKSVVGEDGQIDRRRLAGVVFQSEGSRQRLEQIVHPVMLERFHEEIARGLADDATPLIVLDAAILLEVGWDKVCDQVVFVDAPREARLERLQSDRGWTPQELARREAAQWPVETKRSRADVVIDNSASREECLAQVDRWFEEWTRGQSPSFKK